MQGRNWLSNKESWGLSGCLPKDYDLIIVGTKDADQ